MIGSESETLKIVIKAKDEASAVFKDFRKKNEKTIANLKKIGVVGGTAVVGIGAASVKMAATFDSSMTNVSTLIDTNIESMDDMKAAVLEMSKRTPVALEDLSSALYDVRSAGISAGSAMKVLEDSARLGVAGLGTTKESADLLTTAINAFGLQGRDSAEIANVLFKTVKAGKTDISKLSQAFGKMAGNAKAANITFEDAQAATASLTALTGKTSEAQNALAQVFLELTVQGGKLDKALQKNGGSLDELNKKIGEKGLVGGMKEMQEELGLTETEFKNLFSSAEGGTSVFQLLTDAYDANNEAVESMKDGTDLMSEAFRKQNETAANQYQILKNELNVELIKLGNHILPVLIASIPVMKQMWEDVTKTFDLATEALSDLFVKMAPIVDTITTWIEENKKLTQEITLGSVAFAALSHTLKPLVTMLPGLVAGFSLLMSPIGLVIAAFVLLAVLIYNQITKWEEFKASVIFISEAIKNAVVTKFNEIKNTVGEVINWITEKINGVITKIDNVVKKTKEAVGGANKKVSEAGEGLGGWIQGGMSRIGLPTWNDFISRPGSAPVSFSPDDTIIGVKNPAMLGGGGITINVNGGNYLDRNAADKFAELLGEKFRRELR